MGRLTKKTETIFTISPSTDITDTVKIDKVKKQYFIKKVLFLMRQLINKIK
jgi:hypothetical protein